MRPYKSHWPNLFWEYRFPEHRRAGRRETEEATVPGEEKIDSLRQVKSRPRDKQVFFSYAGSDRGLRYLTASVLVDHEVSPEEEDVGGYIPNGYGLVDNNAVATCAYCFKVLFHHRIGARMNSLPGLEEINFLTAERRLQENGVSDPWRHVDLMVEREREAGFLVSKELEEELRKRSPGCDLRASKVLKGGLAGTELKNLPVDAAERLTGIENQIEVLKVKLSKQERRLDDIQTTLYNILIKINYIGRNTCRIFEE